MSSSNNNTQQIYNNRNILQGTVSGISSGTVTYGNFNNNSGMIRTDNTYSFRVGNKPVSFQTRQNFHLNNGDFITAVGEEKRGTFYISAVRNETTGAVFEPTTGICFLLGFLFLSFILLPNNILNELLNFKK